MSDLSFQKLVGAGNDFVFISKQDLDPKVQLSSLAKKICDRRYGIGSDGLVVLQKGSTDDLEWEFFNSDGSLAEMCGNAARCVVRFAKENFNWDEFKFNTAIGPVLGINLSDSETQVSWELQQIAGSEKTLAIKNFATLKGQLLNSGVPHFVMNEDQFPLNSLDCLEVQEHNDFAPSGINVTLYRPAKGNNPVCTRSFERGVRDFTLACGTGVIATALALGAASSKQEMKLKAPGGLLRVQCQGHRVFLTGPAISVFKGQIPTRGLYV